MLPEPTLAKREAAAPVLPPAWEMTPLFCEPDVADPGAGPSHPPRRWAGPSRRPRHRPNPRPRAVRGTRTPAPTGNSPTGLSPAAKSPVPNNPLGNSAALNRDSPRRATNRTPARNNTKTARNSTTTAGVKTVPRKDPADLLAVTAEWLRRALRRSFLRYNVTGDLDAAVHAAMNVVGPVLDARDTELARLGRLATAGRATRRSAP
jgi:hypothetical protein